MAENIMLKSVGASAQPCFTPLAVNHYHWEGYGSFSIVLYTSLHAVMKLTYHGEEPVRAIIFNPTSSW